MPLFELHDVRQERGGVAVLHDISLDIPAQQLVSLIGPSGAGKSSLIRLLNRLDDPASGTITYDGKALAGYDVRELRRQVGFVFQSPAMFAGTVAENLRIAATLAGRTATDATLTASLDAAELDASFLTREARRLSGGEQQRVSIARALTSEPRVLLLDEPTSALDPEVAERFMHTVSRLNRERGLSIVMVTHRLAEARAFSDYTVMLEAGRVVESGASAGLFASPREPRTREYVRSAQ
ncbi:MAG: hypothetical protein JWO05_1913 [Gemmatimonadetes bacterium]|nr:hypothetical protein [Gemmatimonadota bacterium]